MNTLRILWRPVSTDESDSGESTESGSATISYSLVSYCNPFPNRIYGCGSGDAVLRCGGHKWTANGPCKFRNVGHSWRILPLDIGERKIIDSILRRDPWYGEPEGCVI